MKLMLREVFDGFAIADGLAQTSADKNLLLTLSFDEASVQGTCWYVETSDRFGAFRICR